MTVKNSFDYAHYANRLAALIDGPEGSELGEEHRKKALKQLVSTLPKYTEKVKDSVFKFDQFAFDPEIMNEILNDAFMEDLENWQVLEDQANSHWEFQQNKCIQASEKATMLMHYMKGLSSDAEKEAKRLFKESVGLAEDLGLTISTKKIEVVFPDSEKARKFVEECESQLEFISGGLVTVDLRLRDHNGIEGVQVDMYGSGSDLDEMVRMMIEDEDMDYQVEVSGPFNIDERIPGYIDGESYKRREMNRRSFNFKNSMSHSM